MLTTLLFVILILALLGGLPSWRYSRDWGWAPSSTFGIVLILVVIWLLFFNGRLPRGW